MIGLTADERLAQMIWREISNPARIYTKIQIQRALRANGVGRTQNVLFSTGVRRLLEDMAEKRGLALVIERGCCFVTTSDYEILHKTVRMLRYHTTLGESIGHEGRGVDILMRSTDAISRDMGSLAAMVGVQGHLMRDRLDAADELLATTFEAGRAAANAAFAKARARAL